MRARASIIPFCKRAESTPSSRELPYFNVYQQGTLSTESELGSGPDLDYADASFDWTTTDNQAPPPPPAAVGYIIYSEDTSPPDYTVSGDASVGAIGTYGDDEFDNYGTVTFTGHISTAVLTVDYVTTVFDGGGITLAPDNVTFSGLGPDSCFATVDAYGTLVLADGAHGVFSGAFDDNGDPTDGLQVGDGLVVVSGGSSSLYAQGLDLGEIPLNGGFASGSTGGGGGLHVLDGASATVVADATHNILIGSAPDTTGQILVSGNGASLLLEDDTGDGIGIVIGDGGDGTLAIQDGGTVTVDGGLVLGLDDAGTGTVDLEGQGASLDVKGTFVVAEFGTGDVTISAGAVATIDGDLIVADADSGDGFVNIDDAASSVAVTGTLMIGGQGTGEVDLMGGATLTVGGDLIVGANSTGVFRLDGDGTSLYVAGNATIGLSDTGELDLSDGAAGTIAGNATIAVGDDSTGTVDLSGDGADLTISGTLLVGDGGDAGVGVSNGSTLQADDIEIAAVAPQSGGDDPVDPDTGFHAEQVQTVTVDDATLIAQTLTVGASGRAVLDVTGGTLQTTDDTTIAADPGSEGQVLLNGGSWDAADITVGDGGKGLVSIADASVTAGDLTIGGDGGGTGVVVVGDGGSLTDDLTMHQGTLAVNGGFAFVNGDAEIAPDAGDKAAVGVNGGTFAFASGTLSVGAGGSGKIAFDQSGMLVGSPDVTLGENSGGSGSMRVSDNGTTVDVDAITVGGSGSGNLTVTNGALLTGSGDADIADAVVAKIQGATVSEGGTWKVGTDLTVGSDGLATLNVKSGGAVDVADAMTIGDGAGAGGIVTVSGTAPIGGGTVPSSLSWGTTLTVGNFGVGTLTISSGAIVAPTLGGFGAIAVGGASGGAGVVSVTGGTLDGATLDLGGPGASGRLSISSGGLVALTGNADVAAGAIVVLSGGTLAAQSVTLQAGAALNGADFVDAGVVDNGLITAKGGKLSIESGLSGSGSAVIQADATLDIVGRDKLRKVQFGGANGVLDLGSVPASGTAATIAGFAAGDTIDLTSAAGGTAGHVSGHELIITGGGSTIASLYLSGTYTGGTFDVGADASGHGTRIVLDASQPHGIPVVTPPAIGVSTPQSINASAGIPEAIAGLSVTDSNAGATITATLLSNTGGLFAMAEGGATVTYIDSDGGVVITGDSADVNAVLATVTYTARAAGTDTLSLYATDSAGDGNEGDGSVSVPDQPPTLTVPSAQTATAEGSIGIAGITVASAVTADAVFTVTLSDLVGTLAADTIGGSEVDGSGSATLTISGDLSDVDADLATLTYTAAIAGSDTIDVSVDDGTGGMATGTIVVTVGTADDPPPTIALPAVPVLTGGTQALLTGVTIGDDDPAGKIFTVGLTLVSGTLDATASGAATVGGDGTGTLTITGDLTDVDATLMSLAATVTLPSGQAQAIDTLVVTAADNLGANGTADLLLSVSAPVQTPALPPDGTFFWAVPYGSGAYSDAANWTPTDGPPGSADTAEFGPGLYTVTGDGTAGQVLVGGALTYAGTLTAVGLPGLPGVIVDGGSASFGAGAALASDAAIIVGNTAVASLNFAAGAAGTFDTTASPGDVSVDLGVTAGSEGVLTAAGAGTTLSSNSDWEIGDAGLAQVLISDGAVVSVGTGYASSDFATVLGDAAGSSGVLNVAGAGSRFDDAGGIYVGVAGTGDLVISGGATVTSDAPAGLSGVVGLGVSGLAGNPGSGLVAISGQGSIWDSEQDTTIGYYASGAVYVFGGGTFESDGTLLRVGRVAGSTGAINLYGPGSTLIASSATVLLGDAGIGSVSLYGNAAGSVADVIVGAEGGSGMLDLDASTLTASGGVTVDSGTITLTDEVAYDAATSADVTDPAILSAASLVIDSGGTVLDSGTINATITLDGGTLAASGTLADAFDITGGSAGAPSAVLTY